MWMTNRIDAALTTPRGAAVPPLDRACPTKGARDLCRALCRRTLSKMARNRTVRQSVRQRLATKWAEQMVLGQDIMGEEPLAYSPNSLKDPAEPLFHHEGLEVYRAALGFMEWFVSRQEARELSNRLFRQIDEAGASVVLNIAEGNGRVSELDHHRFLQIAQSAA